MTPSEETVVSPGGEVRFRCDGDEVSVVWSYAVSGFAQSDVEVSGSEAKVSFDAVGTDVAYDLRAECSDGGITTRVELDD